MWGNRARVSRMYVPALVSFFGVEGAGVILIPRYYINIRIDESFLFVRVNYLSNWKRIYMISVKYIYIL